MKHRSRLLSIAVVPILFSRSARDFFHNDTTLRTNTTLSLMNDYQTASNPPIRLDTSRLNTLEQQHIQATESLIEQLSSHLQDHYKFHAISTKLNSRKISRSSHVQTSGEHNFHRSEAPRRATLLAEISSLNHVQLVVRFLQYDIVKTPTNHQTTGTNNHLRQMPNDSHSILEQTELDAFVYDFHLLNMVRHQTKSDETNMFTPDFPSIAFLQEFIEYYPSAPTGSKTALFKTIIRHPFDINKRSADTDLFNYVLEHATIYNIQSKNRNTDKYLFDSDSNHIYWMAACTTPSVPSELTVVMYIIYTNLTPKTLNLPNIVSTSLYKVPIPVQTNVRITNSLKNSSSNSLIRERAPTILLPSIKSNLVVPIRSNSSSSDQQHASNIPTDRTVEYFRSKLISILDKASLSHRRESLWERLIPSRPETTSHARQDITPINTNELQSLLDSCVGDEIMELKTITSFLQRVFSNREQADRLSRFLRARYGSQFHLLTSTAVNYLVIFQCKAPQQCYAFIVLIHRLEQNSLKSCLVKHRNDIDCSTFIQVFTQRISYFLWECLI